MEKLEFYDTHMIEPEDEEFFDTSEKILKLSDALAEEIVLDNIREQLSTRLETIGTRINYISIFREKYSAVDPSDDYYDEEYMKESLSRVAALLEISLKEKYGVEYGTSLEFTTPAAYLEDMETLYEFLFIRQYENLVNYFISKLRTGRANFLSVYKPKMSEEKHSKDIFVVQSKKKFKNNEDVVIIHFLNEIIQDIADTTTSAYTLFNEIVELDLFEEYNDRMKYLLENIGNKIVLNNDENSARLYLQPLKDILTFSSIKNDVLLNYLETCELND